jgi:transposase
MVYSGVVELGLRPRRRNPLSEKRRIIELTFQPGASVAQTAQVLGVNANQMFKWRRDFECGELTELSFGSTALLLDTVSAPSESMPEGPLALPEPVTSGFIHTELPGRAMMSVECGADGALLRSILECLRK